MDPIAPQIFEREIAAHRDVVGEGSESPALAAGLAATHQRVAPIEVAAAGDVHVDALVDPRVGERDQWMPMAVQVSRNTQVVSTNGAVSAGMPIGDSATVMAANTTALKIAPINE